MSSRSRLVLLASLAGLGCPTESRPAPGASDAGDAAGDPTSGSTSTSGGGVTSTPTPTATSGPSTSEDEEGGIIFDVFGVGGSETGTGGQLPGGPGSCRASELFGAAGGYPAFEDPDYADFLDRQVLFMTSNPSATGFALQAIDISGDPPPPNLQYYAPMYRHPAWTGTAFGGGVFGLTLDSFGNLYVAATRLFGTQTTPGAIYRIDGESGEVSLLVELPNEGPGLGNINYDCVSETIYASNHEDGRIYQVEMNGTIRSTYKHSSGEVTMGEAADAGEPDGIFTDLGDRVWAVQSHAGRLYYSVWWEDSGRRSDTEENEIWSIGYTGNNGVPDPDDIELVATVPGLDNANWSNPVSDMSFAATGWLLAAERTMTGDANTLAHSSTTYEYQQIDGVWQVVGETYVVGELPNSSAGGVDHDFEPDGYVWMSGDALDFYTDEVVYGVQGTPYGGGDITNSTLIDHDAEVVSQDKTALGDVEIPIPGDAMPPPPPPG